MGCATVNWARMPTIVSIMAGALVAALLAWALPSASRSHAARGSPVGGAISSAPAAPGPRSEVRSVNRVVAMIVATALATGCQGARATRSVPEAVARLDGHRLEVTLADGRVLTLDSARVRGDSLRGLAGGRVHPEPVAVPTSAVRSVRLARSGRSMTLGRAVGYVLLAACAAVAAIYVVALTEAT